MPFPTQYGRRTPGALADEMLGYSRGLIHDYTRNLLEAGANTIYDLAIQNHNLKTTIERLHMSTHDVPGANPINNDTLKMGCWAEHADGSLIRVEGTEDQRVVYSIFDVAQTPPLEYRDTMKEGAFKKTFSWNSKDPASEKWTWHDKTPFPWDRIIKDGAKDGLRLPHADEIENAAQRVRRSREIRRGQAVDPVELESRIDRLGEKASKIVRKLQRAIEELKS